MIGMTQTFHRHQAGAPASQGGEFKTHDRAEADVSLDPAVAAAATLSQTGLLDAAYHGGMLSGDSTDGAELAEVAGHRNNLGDWCPWSYEKTPGGRCPIYCREDTGARDDDDDECECSEYYRHRGQHTPGCPADDGNYEPAVDWGQNNITEGSRTPWGSADHVTNIADGITSVSTPGHGGVKLSAERNRAVHPDLRVKGGWYEEDCEQAIVAFTFPEETRIRPEIGYTVDKPLDEHVADSNERVRNWFPDGWEAATGNTIEPGQSYVRDRDTWSAAHTDDFIVTTASTDDNDPESVIVTARHGNDEERFRIPKSEYQAARENPEPGQDYRFAIDRNRHESLGAVPKPPQVPTTRFHGLNPDAKLTSAAQAKVDKDLNKRWRLKDGSVKSLSQVLDDEGVTGKGVYVDGAKREYYLVQKEFEADPGGVTFPVTKATWDAVAAPDTRTPATKIREDISVAQAQLDTLEFGRNRGFTSFRSSDPDLDKRRKLQEKLDGLREALKAAAD